MNDEIATKLEQLREYITILKGYQHHQIEDLQTDHTLKGAVERYLEIALESTIDIGEMIISRENLKRPESYQDVFLILGEHGILPKNFAIKYAPYSGTGLSTCMRK
jgi:uncharacterized protein YutE (UPF0331/DUF86 family)